MTDLSKYFNDNKFIQWVYNPNPELEEWWRLFEAGNPEEKNNIRLAKNIIQNLKTVDKQIPEEEKLILFFDIIKKIEEYERPVGTFKIAARWMKYAAIAVLFFSIGAILFYRNDNFHQQYYSQELMQPISASEATLIRPDGENIILKNKKSVIEYEEDGQIKIDNNIIKPLTKNNKTAELNQLVIPYGKTSEILLSDGTKVYLNAGSRLIYPDNFMDKNRKVLLFGEAFFEVRYDKEHPFIVQTADVNIKVLGTRFNVSAYPSDKIVETVLTEGKIRIEENNSGLLSEKIDLVPNQLASFNKETKEMILREVDPNYYTLWKENLFKFESTDFNRVVKKLERYYNIRFAYDDPILGMIKISGKLELEEDYQETINRLAVAASVKINQKGENLYEISR